MARPVVEYIVDGKQKCRRCKVLKTIDHFHKDVGTPSGICRYCKICTTKRRQESRLRKKENRLKCRMGFRKDMTPEELKRHTKDSFLKRQYGITIQDYDKILAEQNGGCAICGRSGDKMFKGLFVDHDHRTDKIRGLLCHGCNSALGLFRDDPEVLQKAFMYIRRQWIRDWIIPLKKDCPNVI